MQDLLLRGALVTLCVLLWSRSANSQCILPDDQGVIKQYVVVVDQTPIRLSAAICSNTTITVAGTTLPVTNAPTVLLSDFLVENTITYTSTLSPTPTFNGPVSTITRGVSQGTAPSTIVFGPQEGSGVGTEIVLHSFSPSQQGPSGSQRTILPAYDPAQTASGSIPENVFPELLDTITAPWTGTVTSTLVLPPQGTDGIERQVILTPASAPSQGPITAATSPWTGTMTTTLTIPPVGTDSNALRLVLTPTDANSPSRDAPAGAFTTLTAIGTGPGTSTVVLPPAGSDTIGTEILLVPTTAGDDDPDILPAEYVPTTAAGPGTVTTTFTIPPAGTDPTGTLLIIDPAIPPSPSSDGSQGGGDDGSDDGPLDAFFGPFTTITAPFTGLAPTTIDLPPAGSDGTGTRIVLNPTPQLRPFNGPVTRVTATVTGTILTTLTILPALFGGTATAIVINPANTDPGVAPAGTLPATPAVVPVGPTGPPDFGLLDPSSTPADPVLPAIVSPVVPGGSNIFTNTFGGSATSTTTRPPAGPSGQIGFILTVIPTPSSDQGPITTATSSPAGPSQGTSSARTVTPNSPSSQPTDPTSVDPNSRTTSTTSEIVLPDSLTSASSSSPGTSTSAASSTARVQISSASGGSASTSSSSIPGPLGFTSTPRSSPSVVTSTSAIPPTSATSSGTQTSRTSAPVTSASPITSSSSSISGSPTSSATASSPISLSSSLTSSTSSSPGRSSPVPPGSSSTVSSSTSPRPQSTTSSTSIGSSSRPTSSSSPGVSTSSASTSSTRPSTTSSTSSPAPPNPSSSTSTGIPSIAPLSVSSSVSSSVRSSVTPTSSSSTSSTVSTSASSVASSSTASSTSTRTSSSSISLGSSSSTSSTSSSASSSISASTTSSLSSTTTSSSTSSISSSSSSSSRSVTSLTPIPPSSTTRIVPTTSFTGCVVTTTATSAPTCVVTLPGSCAQLPTTNGLIPLTLLTATCLVDLGPFAVGPVALCLTTNLGLNPQGQPIADCLLQTLRASCPQTIPQPCVDLQVSNGIDLLVDIPTCIAALGPYNAGAASVCLALNSITSATTGLSIFGCLQGAFSTTPTITTTTVTDPALCPTTAPAPPTPVCPTVPGNCLSLSTVNGLDLLADIPACTQALGLFAVGNVATCLVTGAINILTTGQSIVSCIQAALASNCITALPQVCLDLSAVNGAVDTSACLAALGPLVSVGGAANCLSSGLTSGSSIVQCLNTALFS